MEAEEDVAAPNVLPKKEEDNNGITLLSTLKTETKGKKRKHSNPENDEIKRKQLKQEENSMCHNFQLSVNHNEKTLF